MIFFGEALVAMWTFNQKNTCFLSVMCTFNYKIEICSYAEHFKKWCTTEISFCSQSAILNKGHSHLLKVFRCSFFHTEMYWENRLLFRSGSQERKYTKVSRQRNMILSSTLTLLKINLSYWELFGPFLLNNLLRLLMGLVWNTFTFYLNSNIHIFLLFLTEAFC